MKMRRIDSTKVPENNICSILDEAPWCAPGDLEECLQSISDTPKCRTLPKFNLQLIDENVFK